MALPYLSHSGGLLTAASLLRLAMLAHAILLACDVSRLAAAEGTTPGFQFKKASDKSLGLWEGERPVLVYNHGDIASAESRRTPPHSNYVHPLYGLDGEVLTDDFPEDHRHHRGLYWAWPHIRVGDSGKELSLWEHQGIRYQFRQWLAQEVDDESARLGVANDWVVDDKEVMKEEAWLTVHPSTVDGRAIDVELKWTPTDEPITLWGAEEKSYGGFTLRYAPREQTTITVPAGRTSEDLVVTKLPWADLSAKFKGASSPSGAAVFVDPAHPNAPLQWMTRDYGLLAVGWPGVNKLTLDPGKTVVCRYRVWIHRGMPKAEALQRQFEAYVQTLKWAGAP
jgi:hypothetical protein